MSSLFAFASHLPVFSFHLLLHKAFSELSVVLKGHVCCEEISGLWHCMQLLDMRADKISLNSTIVGVFFGENGYEQTQKLWATVGYMCTTFTTQNLTSTARWKMPTLCTHTLTHLSAWGGQQGLPVLFKALSEAAAVGKEMWAAEGRLRGGSQMKAPKPFRSARTSPSFPEAEAAILIFLKLAKKIPRICTENCAYSIPLPLIPLLYWSTRVDCYKARWSSYFISRASADREGISSVLQASQKLRGVGEMCELEASGDVDLHNTLPLSLLVYSLSLSLCVSLPLVSDLQEWQQRELGEEKGRPWRQGYTAFSPSERGDRIKQKKGTTMWRKPPPPLVSFFLVSCLSLRWGSSYGATHLSSADLRPCALTSCHVNTKNCVGFMVPPS